mgnify:CR=1 FL=1
MSERYLDSDSTLYDYTVIVPKSNGSGALGETLSTPLIGEPLIGEPLIGYTQSFIGIGKFKDKDECIACFKYIKTKFCRVMLGTLKVTQDNNKGTWKDLTLTGQNLFLKSINNYTRSMVFHQKKLASLKPT